MKKLATVILIILSATLLTAQVKNISNRQKFKQFEWECATSLSVGISGTSAENSSDYYSDRNSGNGKFYSEISLALGFFILDGLSIEPEIDYNFFSEDVTLSVIGNVSYTINIPGKKIYPYFKVGYGISSPTVNRYNYYGGSNDLFGSLDANVINAGAGLKIVQSSSFAVRLELNYKYISYSQSQDDPYYDPYNDPYDEPIEISANTSVLSIKIGGSFLF